MTPKIVDKGQRKQEIALKALGIFAEKGFEAASISQIAEAAGVGKGTIYDYFSSKEELVVASLTLWMEQMMQGLELLVADISDPAEQLRVLCMASMEVVEADPFAVQLMISVTQLLLRSDSTVSSQFIRDGFHRFRVDVMNILLNGVSQGTFRPEIAKDAEKIAINLLAYLDGIGMHFYFSNQFFDLKEQLSFYVENLIDWMEIKSSNASDQLEKGSLEES